MGINTSFTGSSICLVIPSLQAGGMERVMSELAWYLSSRNSVDLHLILYGINREIFFDIPDNIILHIPEFRFNNRRRIYFTFKTLFYLRKTIRGIEADSVLSFGEYWNNLVLLSTLGLRSPVYVSDRSQPDKSLGRLHDSLRFLLYRRARGVIMQTEQAREVFLKRNRHNNVTVIGNPIRDILNGRSFPHREKTILMVGRLIQSKHQDRLIEIFARINPNDWKLILVGYDHLKQQHMERLKALTKELSVEDRVVFMGKQDNIDDIYLQSSIFAFTSSSEGFPNAIGEAMSAGLPVIAYDCVAGPSEMIKNGHNGFLVPLFDDMLFCDKLDMLIRDQKLRESIGNNAAKDIKRFAIEEIGEQYLNFLLNVSE